MSGISISGPIFISDRVLPSAIDKAVRETRDWAIGIIQKKTPVRTGNLKRGFVPQGDAFIYNDVTYYPYVEDGTRYFIGKGMVRRSVKSIERRLTATLENAVLESLE